MSEKILVVEDNEQNRILLRYLLKHHGFEVIEAADGATGIACAREQRPDLILMDLQMPVLDGYTAIKLLKKDKATKDIKIIAVTSFAMKGDREKALEAGADGYISKPIDTELLIGLIKGLLGEKLQ